MFLLQTLGGVALHTEPASGEASEPLLGGVKPLVVLAYVALRPDRTCTRQHLAELFWPGAGAGRARRSLRQTLYSITAAGAEGILEADGTSVRFRPERCAVDLERFERALREADFETAARAYGGPFLQGFRPGRCRELESWIESVRERLTLGYRQALHECVLAASVRSDAEEAVACARRATEAFPLDDGLQAILLSTLVDAGRAPEAVRAFEAYRVLLRREVDDDPSAELAEVAEHARALAAAERERTIPAPSDVAAARRDEPPAPADVGPATGGSAVGSAAGPVGVPVRGHGAVRESRRRLGSVPALVIAAVVGLGGWAAWTLAGPSGQAEAEASGTPGAPSAAWVPRLRVQLAAGGFATVEVEGDPPSAATVLRRDGAETPQEVPSPDGRLIARRVPTAHGPDIDIVDAGTGERIGAVPNRDGRTPDDHIQGWAPDGRRLLFDSGLPIPDGRYDQRAFIFDVASGEVRALSGRQVPPERVAAWSPAGHGIALVGLRDGTSRRDAPLRTDLFLVRPDGSGETALTDDDAFEADPAWSPDGTRIAFRKGPWDAGDVHVVDLRTGEERPLAATPWPERSPVWLSDGWVVYVADRDGGWDLWAVPAGGGTPRRLSEGLGLAGIMGRLGPPGSAAPVERVRAAAAAPGGALSPGEHAVLAARAFAADSTPVPLRDLPFAWRSLDPGRARLAGIDVVEVLDTGTVRLVADVGGWRADTLVLRSLPVVEVDAELLLAEDWAEGIDPARWRAFGHPAPSTLPGGGPGGGRFRNDGDASGESGVLSAQRFPLAGGLTVEAYGRVPLTGARFQTFRLALAPDPFPEPGAEELGSVTPLVSLSLMTGRTGAPDVTAWLDIRDAPHGLPEPPGVDTWRRHALQLHPDGAVEWLIDGRRFASGRLTGPLPADAHVVLAGRSVGTVIEHGPLRVWRGVRYFPAWNLPDREP
ncbi:MAG: BTAD domain-containing putative transcriptional regulator [Gemmatimonadota bacterium]|nr:BTAD domain-containing putative transcriptional regulator [Gemmatimonadota bacterium]